MVKIFRTKLIKNLTIFGQPSQLFVQHEKIYVKCSDFALQILDAENKMVRFIKFSFKKIMNDLNKKYLIKNKRSVQVCTRCIYDEDIPEINFDNKGVCNYCYILEDIKKKNYFWN